MLLSPQGADDLISLDALSTVKEMDVANFRRVSRMPIYGTAQPSAKVTIPGDLGPLLVWQQGRVELFFQPFSCLPRPWGVSWPT